MTTATKRSDIGFKPIIQNLNKKFFDIPPNITITADDSNDSQGGTKNRTIIGMKGFLDKNPIAKGVTHLSNVDVRWWIEPEDFAKNNGTLLGGEGGAKGHLAVIHKGEIYMRPAPSNLWLQKFSILAGGNQIFLYVEPLSGDIRADITRSALKINGSDIPLEEIAAEFKEKMPKALQDFMNSKLGDENSKTFKQRLQQLMERIKIPRFRKDKGGDITAEIESEYDFKNDNGDGPGREDGDSDWDFGEEPIGIPKEHERTGGGGVASETYYCKEGGNNKAVQDGRGNDYPKIIWLSRNPEDTNIGIRDEGDMEDRVGRYIMSTNTLFINADFRLIKAVNDYWKRKLGVKNSTELTVIRRAVHSSYELTLADAIIHTRHLARTDGGEGWTDAQVARVLEDDMNLTAIASGMFHPTSTLKHEIKKDLGRIGDRL